MIGRRLKFARAAAGLSLRGLEARIGGRVTAQAIGKYERNECESMPGSGVLIAPAQALDDASRTIQTVAGHNPAVGLYLVACVKKKRSTAAPAKDLYTSNWFRKARAYVEGTGFPWRVLSARYGLVDPDEMIRPYDTTLNAMFVADRRAWASTVIDRLGPLLAGTGTVVFLAGRRYREFLELELRRRGVTVLVPMAGLTQGRQLSWLKERLRD